MGLGRRLTHTESYRCPNQNDRPCIRYDVLACVIVSCCQLLGLYFTGIYRISRLSYHLNPHRMSAMPHAPRHSIPHTLCRSPAAPAPRASHTPALIAYPSQVPNTTHQSILHMPNTWYRDTHETSNGYDKEFMLTSDYVTSVLINCCNNGTPIESLLWMDIISNIQKARNNSKHKINLWNIAGNTYSRFGN